MVKKRFSASENHFLEPLPLHNAPALDGKPFHKAPALEEDGKKRLERESLRESLRESERA